MAIVGDITSNELKDYYYIPPSTIFPYAGTAATTPDGWLFCDGSSYGTATYPDLFSVIGYSYGGSGTTFSVPDLRGRVIAGRDMDNGSGTAGRLSTVTNQGTAVAVSAGAQTHTLTSSEMPSHHHGTSSITSGTTNSTGGHQHTGNTSVANLQHSHEIVNEQYFANVFRQQFSPSGGVSLASGPNDITINTAETGMTNAGMSANVEHSHSYTTNEMGAHTHSVTGNIVTNSSGGSVAHNNLQPTIILNYIIKV